MHKERDRAAVKNGLIIGDTIPDESTTIEHSQAVKYDGGQLRVD
jgi:hypothetical protein